MCRPPGPPCGDWMSLSRTSCSKITCIIIHRLSSPPHWGLFLPLLLYLPYPFKDYLWIFYPSLRCCVCPLSFLISLLAANVVVLSFLPTSLAAHTLFWEKYFRFLNGIIWSIILSLLSAGRTFFIYHQLCNISTCFASLVTRFIHERLIATSSAAHTERDDFDSSAASSACSFYEQHLCYDL